MVVDQYCENYPVSKWLGLRVKEVRGKLKNQDELPTVECAKREITAIIIDRVLELYKSIVRFTLS